MVRAALAFGMGFIMAATAAMPGVAQEVERDASGAVVRVAQLVAPSVTVTLPADTVTPAMATKLVEDYVNSIGTYQAAFTQRTTGEQFTQEGIFYLDKSKGSGKFLWDYKTPNRQRLIATGTALYFVNDEQGGAATQLPVKAGLSRLFTGQKLSLAKEGLRVTGATTRGNELEVRMAVNAGKGKDDSGGVQQISLFFEREPMKLVRAQVLDVVDAVTTMQFSDIRTGMPLDAKMFRYTPSVQRQR